MIDAKFHKLENPSLCMSYFVSHYLAFYRVTKLSASELGEKIYWQKKKTFSHGSIAPLSIISLLSGKVQNTYFWTPWTQCKCTIPH